MLIDDLLEYIHPSTMICICIHNSDGVYEHRINPMPAGIDNKDKLKRAAHLIDTINLLKDRRFWSDS